MGNMAPPINLDLLDIDLQVLPLLQEDEEALRSAIRNTQYEESNVGINRSPFSRYYAAFLLTITLLIGACADKPEPIKRVGILQFTSRLDLVVDNIKQGLAELGYKEDEQITYLYRNAEVNQDSLIFNVQELIDADLDLMIALTTPAAIVAEKYTKGLSIPVIFALVSDPIAAGLIESTGRPGGNVTGVMDAGSLVGPKRLEMLLEVDPAIKRVLVVHSGTPAFLPGIDSLRQAASLLNVALQTIEAASVAEVRAAYDGIAPGSIDAVFVPSDVLVMQGDDALFSLLRRDNIPSIGDHGAGNTVIEYGSPLSNMGRQTAVMAAKVLKGADTVTMPIELPSQYQLKLSATMAEAIGYQFSTEAYQLANHIVK